MTNHITMIPDMTYTRFLQYVIIDKLFGQTRAQIYIVI